jgi:hypothetical protein
MNSVSSPASLKSVCAVLDEVPEPAQKVLAALRLGLLQNVRVGQEEVGRGEDVEDLPAGELQRPFVLGRYAAYPGCRVVPPLLLQEEALVDQVERPLVPFCAFEPPVLRERADARLDMLADARHAMHEVARQPRAFADSLVPKLELLAGRKGQVDEPVEIGFGEGRRRETQREARHRVVERPVDHLCEPQRGIVVPRRGEPQERGDPRGRRPGVNRTEGRRRLCAWRAGS